MFSSHALKKVASRLRHDTRGASATEFAIILPMMLVLLFALIEISNGVAADRKVTLTARSLSDLVSQATTVTDSDLNESFAASRGVMYPFDSSAIKSVISEVKIDANKQATVAWSKPNANASAMTSVTLPPGLDVANTYLIWSHVTYTYKPMLPMSFMEWLIPAAGITLTEQFFTRPRQSNCVLYNQSSCP